MNKEVPNFVTCHCHVASLDSASTPEEFARREVELDTGFMTITDHGTLGSCRAVYDLCKGGVKLKDAEGNDLKGPDGKPVKKKLTPILGLEAYFRDDNCPILESYGVKKDEKGTNLPWWKYSHLTMGFLDQNAYETAVKVLSRLPSERIERHGSELKPLFDWRDLEEILASNTTVTTGCLIGIVPRHLVMHDAADVAMAHYDRLRSLARPGNFYVEVFPHVCDRYWDKGVYVTLRKEDGSEEVLKFWMGKKLKTDGTDEIESEKLAEAFSRKDSPHKRLLAVKDNRTWAERPGGGQEIVAVKRVEDFLMNDCRPWSPDGDLQRGVNRFMLEMARRRKDPVLIGDDSHYAYPDEGRIQDIRLLSGGGTWRFHGDYSRKSGPQAFEVFSSTLGMTEARFRELVDSSRAWAERFKSFEWKTQPSLPAKFYPEDTLGYTRQLIAKHDRLDPDDAAEAARLEQEIDLLHRNGTIDLLPYFFPEEEGVEEYTKKGQITGAGRGSAAGLVLTYALGITHIHPLKYALSLDRFITPDRIKDGAFPDIDQDLPSQEIIAEWLQRRFGRHQARISVDQSLRIRSSCKDAARAHFGYVPPDIEALTNKFEKPPQGVSDHSFVFGYEDSGEWKDGSIEYDPALQEFVAKYPRLWKDACKLMGLTRQKSQHPCAWIIAGRPIDEWIPMIEVGEDRARCTAYTPASVEAVGGIKYDFLGINTLKDISAAIAMIQKKVGAEIPDEGMKINRRKVPKCRVVPLPEGGFADVWDLPEDIDVVQGVVMCEGDNETVFQFNTPGVRKWMRVFSEGKPEVARKVAEGGVMFLAAFTALDRPGTLKYMVTNPEDGTEHNVLVEYARRLKGKPRSPDILPVFDELCPETQGLMVFQENLQYAYQQLTGCTLSEAEGFRRDVAKKKKEKILAVYPQFLEKAGAKIGRKNAEAVWASFAPWSEYGFNKSHAVCYAYTGYVCAWLKHHYPLEWWCAVLRNADKNDIQEKFWKHCGKLVDLPDVSKSGSQFEVQGDRIRAPLSLLKGIAQKSHDELMAGAPYSSIADLCQKIERRKVETSTFVDKTDEKTGEVKRVTKKGRSALHRGILYTLVVSGAMDSLFAPEATALEKLSILETELGAASGKKPEKVKKEFLNLDPLVLYQRRKEILPMYSAPIVQAVARAGLTSVFVPEQGARPHWTCGKVDHAPFVTGREAERLANLTPYPSGDETQVALAAYVVDTRPFGWGEGKKNPAIEMVLDVGGTYLKLVKWSDRKTNRLPDWAVPAKLKGAVVVVGASKYKEGKPLSAVEVEMVRPPLDAGDKEGSEEQK